MIEKKIKNDLNLRRWRLFKKQKRAVFSAWMIILFSFFSFTAEMWSNNRPIIMQYNNKIYFPVFKNYHPSIFGIQNRLTTDYRALSFQGNGWALWPLNKWDPFESNKEVTSYPSQPTSLNILGTDDRGRDIFARILYGYRYSFTYAALVWFFSTLFAILFGGVMGYAGGRIDLIGQRAVEILSTMPYLLLLILLISIFRPSLFLLIIVTCFFGWISLSYYVRAEFLKNRKREFVEAARAMGGGHLRIILKHILPNSLIPVITFAPFILVTHITGLAILDYLGFGLAPPTPSWGELLQQAQKNFTTSWWLAVYPSLALSFTLIFLALIGDGIRVAFDPKQS